MLSPCSQSQGLCSIPKNLQEVQTFVHLSLQARKDTRICDTIFLAQISFTSHSLVT